MPDRPAGLRRVDRVFSFRVLGALAVALPAVLLFGNAQHLPNAPRQWVVLLFLVLCATALGMYWWNKGACLVNGATLAVMKNLHVPVRLLINLLIWGQNEDQGTLFLGGLVIVSSVWISRRGLVQRRTVL